MFTVDRTDPIGGTSGPSEAELEAMRLQAAAYDERPVVSVIVVVTDPDEIWIRATCDSILSQVYDEVELCVCDNASTRPHVRSTLGEYTRSHPQVKVTRTEERCATATATLAACELAVGDLVAFADAGDTLPPDALFRIVDLYRATSADVIYTDEEVIDEVDERIGWLRKPYWSSDLLLARPYIGRLFAIRRGFTDELRHSAQNEAWEYDLILRVTERARRIEHLPWPAYRRRRVSSHGDALDLPAAATEAHAAAATSSLRRRGIDAVVTSGLAPGSLRTMRKSSRAPKITAIVSLSRAATTAPILQDLRRRTSIEIPEVIVAGGRPGAVGAEDQVELTSPATMANRAAERAKGDLLLFVEGRARLSRGTWSGWLDELAALALDDEVGAVGCRIAAPDGTLQYGGIAVDLDELLPGSRSDACRQTDNPLVLHASNPAVVPAECLLVRSDLFRRMNGFNDRELPTALYDVDLSFRLLEEGHRNVYRPEASIVSAAGRTPPDQREIGYVWHKWWERLVWLLGYQPGTVRPFPERALGSM